MSINSGYYFGLVFLLSVPVWLFGALVSGEFLPGLPVSAGMAICPGIAGVFLAWRVSGAKSVRTFLYKAIDFKGMRPWVWLVALGTMPVVMFLSGILLIALGGSLPPLEFKFGQTLALFAMFLVAATAEELGWTGYVTRPLVQSNGMILAALIIGGVSVIWHAIPLLQAGRTWDWIAWWAVGSIGRRVIMVWLYIKGGHHVFATSLFHAMSNVSWMLFPAMGSHYDPMTTALILLALSALTVSFNGNSDDIEMTAH